MRKTVAKRWATALRGNYRQVCGALHVKGKGYCVLGVLCDIAPKHLGTWQNGKLKNGQSEGFGGPGEVVTGRLPQSVRAWARMKSTNGRLGDASLAGLNDSGRSFLELADLIEQNAEKL